MNHLFYPLLGLTLFCGLCALASYMLGRASRAASERVFAITQGVRRITRDKPRPNEFRAKFLQLLALIRSRMGVLDNERLTARLAQAGFKSSSARDIYLLARFLGPLLALILGSFLPGSRISWMIGLPAVCYLAPDIVLSRLVKKRREKIRLSVPDAVDLLVICVDAGLGLDQAMLRAGQELNVSHPEIYEELMQINREQRAGKLRLEAWEAMAKRSELEEIDGFVNMLMQTERFGTPIAKALSNFADGIRQKRRQKAEELAAKTTVKIIFPLVLFIFPSMFIVLLGPAGIGIFRALAEAGQ
jgi:tight adherence protein C